MEFQGIIEKMVCLQLLGYSPKQIWEMDEDKTKEIISYAKCRFALV